MTLHIFNKKEKQEILNKLKNQFGISKLPGQLIKIGGERIFFFSGNLNKNQILELENLRINIERIGIYFGKEKHNQIRLSIDGAHLLKDQIKKNIFEINSKQVQEWMQGNELNIKSNLNGFAIIKHNQDFLGTGKASENKITNFIPKSRRLKSK